MEDEEEIAGVVTRYFENIFKAGDCDRLEECLVAVHPKVSPDMRDLCPVNTVWRKLRQLCSKSD